MIDKPIATLAAATLAAVAAMAASCASQPPVKCTASSNPGATRFKVIGMPSGDCSEVPLVMNGGEVIGVQTYVPSVSDPNTYTLPNSVALQSEEASNLVANGESVDPPVVDAEKTHHLYSLGKFDDSFPDGNDICRISTLTPSEINLPEVPEHMDADMMTVPRQPATHIKYEWSNVRIIVRADSIGTQTFADLTYTREGEKMNKTRYMCTAHFSVSILTPLVSCDTDGMVDQTKCDAPTDPAVGAVPPGTTKCEVQGEQTVCLPNKEMP